MAPPMPPGPGPADAQFDTNLVRMLNELRGKKNLQPLSFNPMLTRVAQAQAKLLAKGMPVDPNYGARVTEAGYKFANLFMTNTSVRELNAGGVLAAWPQRDDIALKPEFRDIGIGVDSDANNNYYIAILLAAEQKQ
jgi:uncharacterized protein YkwD